MAVHGVAPVAVGVMVATSVLFVLASISIVLRFVARRRTNGTGIDDWTALSAYIFLLAVSICHYLITAPYGYAGQPQSEFSVQQMRQFLMVLYADNICYTCCTVTVKLSILLLLRRIFTTRPFRITTIVFAGILIVWWITVLCFQIFSCKPVHSFWDFTLQESCIDTTKFYNGVAISNIIFDFALLILPLPMVWQLQMSIRRKFQVSFIFVLGGFTVICSILRTHALGTLDVANTTGTITGVGMWTIIECGVGVICSCLPPTAVLFRSLQDKVRSTVRTHKTNDSVKLLDMGIGSSGSKLEQHAPPGSQYSVI
ncbi:hypothetical protein N8I77_005653 [Diaporthe amygdali]|uniref:Rhodopsin domain-containing protein n=1 Tax=Phomopsis amygdali TaxID=1214568 RepID=A0AAD9SG40_PHOAM|nr:uncharacterized protein J7T55_005993 [Diaporthe amygdali]KAJ0124653.1 hypothetical protein J7T55_005993 [Diaporthe amygdali]KAK2606934.1 hypothetical protein N8I77_005653 [Diaporthe amygdali]